nr:MAG TPA: hypothetical protein [Caudoviricetes sp.]
MAKKNETNTSFTKEQLYSSKKYEMQKDILGVMLEDNKEYTFDEVDNLIKEFLKREVE